MASLAIRLLPYMQQSAQEFSLNNVCRLCVLSMRNQLKACKNSLLLDLINLLEHHDKFDLALIQKLFDTIQILGRSSINQTEVSVLVELLHPKKQFPYGIHILRCFTLWAKHTTAVGLNLGLIAFQSDGVSGSSGLDSDSAATSGGLTAGNNLSQQVQNENNLLAAATGNLAIEPRLKRTSIISINQTALTNMMSRTTGAGAIAANAQQQAKYFFDFQHSNSVSNFCVSCS